MKQIRRGVFETNSSSTHSLTMCPKRDFDSWAAGNLYFNQYSETKFVTKEQAIEIALRYSTKDIKTINDEELLDLFKDVDIYTYDSYMKDYDSDLETFTYVYKTESGDEVVAFGKYGTDC